MTIEELLRKEDDSALLNIYEELESCIVPATSYAHEYVRKVNRMINEGRLCIVPGKYRTVYLPTISKLIYKELARRYANFMRNMKPAIEEVEEDESKCSWCNEEYDTSELYETDLGRCCEQCITAIRSRGEDITIYI